MSDDFLNCNTTCLSTMIILPEKCDKNPCTTEEEASVSLDPTSSIESSDGNVVLKMDEDDLIMTCNRIVRWRSRKRDDPADRNHPERRGLNVKTNGDMIVIGN